MRADYYDLQQFLGCYLHEDWPEMYGSPDRAVDAAIAESGSVRLEATKAQFKDVMRKAEDDVELRRILNDCFGVNVYFKKPRAARAFAELLARKLNVPLKDRSS